MYDCLFILRGGVFISTNIRVFSAISNVLTMAEMMVVMIVKLINTKLRTDFFGVRILGHDANLLKLIK